MSNIVEAPCVTGDKETFILHNYVNLKGKLVLDRAKASLLLIELYKFIEKD